MSWRLTPDDDCVLEGMGIVLRGVRPVVNGRVLTNAAVHVVTHGPDRLLLSYAHAALQGGRFSLEVTGPDADGRVWLRYWLENLPPRLVLDAFGLRFAAVNNLRAWLRQGYTSWDGGAFVPTGTPEAATGYALIQLLPHGRSGGMILGFERHDRFQHTFTVDAAQQPAVLTVQTLWDRKDRAGLTRCASERLVVFGHTQVEEGLRAWARIVASASPLPPRVPGPALTGWCSWYNLYAAITEENILEHLRGVSAVVRREQLPMQIFQIDDGFTPEMGDWLEVKPQFPRGMRPLLDDIRAAGFIPGLWIAPFMVGNRSHLYREHPDWIVQDRQTGGPLVQMRFYAEFRWHKRSEEYYILDTTHPDAFTYLQQVFHTWRRDWGCGYFKTDFMHFGSEHGPDRALRHTPGLTRIEIWRRVAEMIREEIGDALWLGCGCPLWVPVGLVDGVRIGRDVGVTWQSEPAGQSAQSLLRDLATRNFANRILWQADPDCVLLRERFHYLSDVEVRALALVAGMAGGVIMTSDDLSVLSPERLQLWRLVLSGAQGGCDFPLLGQAAAQAAEPVLVQLRRPSTAGTAGALFLFNTGPGPTTFCCKLTDLGLREPVHLLDWVTGEAVAVDNGRLELMLAGHDGRLLCVSPAPRAAPPEHLPV